jgi:MFS family permease
MTEKAGDGRQLDGVATPTTLTDTKSNGVHKNEKSTEAEGRQMEEASSQEPMKLDRLSSRTIRKTRTDGKVELNDDMAPEILGYAYPTWKKWLILTVIFVVQMSMNFNTSVFPSAVPLITEDPRYAGVSEQGARVGQMIFLVAYAFGSELWAPWSEELGRWPILQLSLFLVNCTQIWAGLSPNFNSLIAARFFGGLFTAGGSVTLGMVADLFDADDQQYAVAYIVLSSVGGTSIGPLIGGIIAGAARDPLYWIFWTQLIFGGFTQLLHFFVVPETRSTVILDREAKRRRKAGQKEIYGPNELREDRFSIKEIGVTWIRPFEMFVREPIVLCLSLLSGFSDALIFTFLESFTIVYEQWNFSTLQIGLAFIPINIGYIIAFFSFFPTIHSQRKIRRRDPDALQPEARLWWLLYVAPLEALGLFGFAWTSLGPPQVHWIAPMIFSTMIAIANYAIYMATIDYMVASYGVYSASATGGNALARDFLAGIAALYATPLYSNIGTLHLEWASTLLGCLAILVTIPIYVFYYKGPAIRERSKFAQTLASDRKGKGKPVSDPHKDEEQAYHHRA